MKKNMPFFMLAVLAVVLLSLQTHSVLLQNAHTDILLIQEEISFLEKDIARDGVLVSQYLHEPNPSNHAIVADERESFNEECNFRENQMHEQVKNNVVSHDTGIAVYYAARGSHHELEEIKETLLESPQSSEPLILTRYAKKYDDVSTALQHSKEELRQEALTISKKNTVNYFATFGAMIIMSFIVSLHIFPRKKTRLLSKREELAIELLKRNQARNTITTIKDVKRECGITHPTAQSLIQRLEEKKLLWCEKKGREKHLFLSDF